MKPNIFNNSFIRLINCRTCLYVYIFIIFFSLLTEIIKLNYFGLYKFLNIKDICVSYMRFDIIYICCVVSILFVAWNVDYFEYKIITFEDGFFYFYTTPNIFSVSAVDRGFESWSDRTSL